MLRLHLLLPILLSLTGYGISSRILAVLPFPSKSRHFFASSILKALVQRGHQVVEYSPYPPSKQIVNHTYVEIHTFLEEAENKWTYEDFLHMLIDNGQPEIRFGFELVWNLAYAVCADAFKQENLKKLLNSNKKFDLVITDSSFGQESMLIFGHKFQASHISVNGFYTWSVINRDAGNSLSVASIPDLISQVTTEQMSFVERCVNLISTSLTLIAYYNRHLPAHEKLIKENYHQDIPPLADMVSNVSLHLTNTHSAVGYSQPYTSNIIPIAGIAISSDRISLPQNLQKFMDEAKEGVIYFSYGTIVSSHIMPKKFHQIFNLQKFMDEAKKGVIYFSFGTIVPSHIMPKTFHQIFVNVFKKVKQKVIWKIDIDKMSGISENVMLTKWVPQPGVLAHPNCVLFMTHGGLSSQHEAINAGVPTITIPFFGDQPYNARFSEHSGFGVKLDFNTLSEDNLISALNTVLNNPKYKENAQRLSRIFNDRPLSPAHTAVYWIEYVLRHGGAHHLRPAAAQLTWYQLCLLDVLAAIVAAIMIVSISMYLVVRKIIISLFSKKNKTLVKSSKKTN